MGHPLQDFAWIEASSFKRIFMCDDQGVDVESLAEKINGASSAVMNRRGDLAEAKACGLAIEFNDIELASAAILGWPRPVTPVFIQIKESAPSAIQAFAIGTWLADRASAFT
jgi:hypothetical protein